jgi:hypothetical protein
MLTFSPSTTASLPKILNFILHIMSAPNAGRQSPDPERQTGAQQQDVPGSGKTVPNAAPSDQHAKDKSEQTKSGLQSNPTHPLEKAAKEKLK